MSEIAQHVIRDHFATFILEDGCISAEYTCKAPLDSECHKCCLEGCESRPCEHDLVIQQQCNIVEWLENVDIEDAHHGKVHIFHTPIHVVWNGDAYEYSFVRPLIYPVGAPMPWR
jgi:hypothetical protein